jgi:hypothetical protein
MTTVGSKTSSRELTSKSAYVALLIALPVLLIFAAIGRWQMGIGAWICAGIVMLVVRTHWDLRGSPWFWLSIVVALVLQVPAVLLIPWGNKGIVGMSLLPLAVVDYGLVYGCMKLAEKVGGAPSAS